MLRRPRFLRWAVSLAALGGVVIFGLGGGNPARAGAGTTDAALPTPGEITVARLPVTVGSVRQAQRLPAGRVSNRAALPADASVYVGVRRKPRSRRAFEALVVVLRPQPAILGPASARGAVKIGLRVRRAVRLRWGRRSQEVNAFSKPGRPRGLCAVRLRPGERVRAGLVAGPPLSYPKGSSAKPRTVLAQSLAAACGRRYDPAFRAAIDGGGRPGPVGSGPPAFRWSYPDAQKLSIVGDVVSGTAFDRLEVRVPNTSFPDPHGPPTEARRITSFVPAAGLPSCSVATKQSPEDTLVCSGGTVSAGEHERLRVRTEPPPADGMGGDFKLSRRGKSRGPFQIAGP